jgi:biopolymer transport protein ExbD
MPGEPIQDGSEALTDEERILRKRRRDRSRSGGGGDEDEANLNINSLMDMMVIILAFLIMSVGSQPLSINQGDDLRLPYSTSEMEPEDMLTITVTKNAILVGDEQVVPLQGGQIDPNYLQSEESALVPELKSKVEELLAARQRLGQQIGEDFEKVATLICDKDTPFRLIGHVLVSAGQGGIQNFRFAIVQRAQGGGVVASE